MISRLLDEEIKRRGISQRQAAQEIGVSHTTVAGVRAGKEIIVSTAYLICKWLNVPLTAAVDDISDEDRIVIQITNTLKAAPELEQIFFNSAKAVEEGDLTREDFQEIMEYISFKLQQRKARKLAKKKEINETE